jgi:hypothetical protein
MIVDSNKPGINWSKTSDKFRPGRNIRCLLTDGNDAVFGCWDGSTWFVVGENLPESWLPTHFFEIEMP